MIEVAVLPTVDCASGVRYLVARIQMFLELRIHAARKGESLFGSSMRKVMGKEWMTNGTSLGAR